VGGRALFSRNPIGGVMAMPWLYIAGLNPTISASSPFSCIFYFNQVKYIHHSIKMTHVLAKTIFTFTLNRADLLNIHGLLWSIYLLALGRPFSCSSQSSSLLPST
jgi:hypothetical protein